MSQPCVFHGLASSCYHLSGIDAFSYLQSQMTIAVPSPKEKSWNYGLWLNENGRVLADSFVYAQADDSCLVWSYDCPAPLLEKTIRRNIIADEVEISNLREKLFFTILTGIDIFRIIENAGYPVPESRSVIETEDYFQYQWNLTNEPYIVFIGSDSFQKKLHQELITVNPELALLPFNHELRHFKRTEACIPNIPQDIGERNIPQEGNLETSAIDFTKGCFPGQEIMASFRKSEKLNKAMFRFSLPQMDHIGSVPIDIYSGNLVVGSLTTVAGNGITHQGLGIIRLRAIDRPLHLKGTEGTAIPIEVIHPLNT